MKLLALGIHFTQVVGAKNVVLKEIEELIIRFSLTHCMQLEML